jgi:hypothetical protein
MNLRHSQYVRSKVATGLPPRCKALLATEQRGWPSTLGDARYCVGVWDQGRHAAVADVTAWLAWSPHLALRSCAYGAVLAASIDAIT